MGNQYDLQTNYRNENYQENEDEILYKKAKKRVQEIKSFYVHLVVYLFVNVALVVLNLIVSPGQLWFYWTTFGWGIGLAAHAISVYGKVSIFGDNWEEEKIRTYMEKYRK